jgi:hypothetical protein
VSDESDAPVYVAGATVVTIAVIAALGWSPNCKHLRDSPGPELAEVETVGQTTETTTEVAAPQYPYTDIDACEPLLRKHRRWIHTRVDDCERETDDNFLKCMWWVFGGGAPKSYGVEPSPGDGLLGYQGRGERAKGE